MTTYLRKRCAGCDSRIEVETPQRHVVSSHTGNAYCSTCTTSGLPPLSKRPLNPQQIAVMRSIDNGRPVSQLGIVRQLVKLELVKETDTLDLTAKGQDVLKSSESTITKLEGSKIRMATATTEKAEKSTEVLDKLIERVKSEVPNVTLEPKSGYVTVKSDGKTVAYVNGKHKLRIESFVSKGAQPTLVIATLDEVDKGFDFIMQGVKARQEANAAKEAAAAEAKQKREQRDAERKAKAEADAAAKAAKAEADAAAQSETPAAEGDVTPDPKPARTRRSRQK